MHIDELHEYDSEPADVSGKYLDDDRRKQVKDIVEHLIADEFAKMEESANEYISQIAARRAETFLERVLNGDEDAAIRLLGDKAGSSRYRQLGCDTGKPWAHLIHGNLFETSGIRLRRKIVEAHVDLLRSERIADLESIVDGLTEQVKDLTRKLEESRRDH